MLSIRTQDRMALVPYDNQIYIKMYGDSSLNKVSHWEINLYVDKEKWVNLGTYKTKERALEVLDEIQQANRDSQIILYQHFDGKDAQLIDYTIPKQTEYQMPKE